MNYKLVPAYGFLPKVKPTVTLTRVLIMLLSTAVTAIIIRKTVKQ